jgi:hypothetical protein
MAVAVLSAVIGAAGTVVGAWIQARGRRPEQQRHAGAGSGSRKAGGQRAYDSR